MANQTHLADTTTDEASPAARPAPADEARRAAPTVYRAMPETEPEGWA